MSENRVLRYLQDKGWKYKTINGGVNLACPFHDCDDHHENGHHFYFYFNNEVFKCVKCGKSGHLLKLKKMFNDLEFLKGETEGKGKVLKPEMIEKYHKDLLSDSESMEYLKARGILKEQVIEKKLGLRINKTTEHGDVKMICFPYSFKGEYTNCKYKSIEQYMGKSGNPDHIMFQEAGCQHHPYGIDSIPEDAKYVIVVEGEYDQISSLRYKIKNVVSVPNGATGFGAWVKDLDRFDKIYMMQDRDEKGKLSADELAKKLGKYRCYRVELPLKDLNDCLKAGVTGAEIQGCLNKAKHYSDEQTVSVDKVIDRVDNLFSGVEKARGLPTGYDNVDKTIGGWRDAEVTIISGDTSSGKTSYSVSLVYNALRRNTGVMVASSEVLVEKVIAKLMSIHTGVDFYDKEKFSNQMYKEAREWILSRNLFFVDTHGEIPLWRLEDAIEYVSRFHHVKFVLLDHLHFFLEDSDNPSRDIAKFTKGLEKIVKRTKVHALLIVHPKQMDDPEILREQGMAFLKGSSSIKQDADNVVVIWRDKKMEEKGVYHVEVIFKKVRDDTGREGTCHFYFDPNTQRYYEKRPEWMKEKVVAKPEKESRLTSKTSKTSSSGQEAHKAGTPSALKGKNTTGSPSKVAVKSEESGIDKLLEGFDA